jgi:hypothetical protein
MAVESWMHGFYLFTAIFGVGVTVIDLIGLLGGTGHGHHGVVSHHSGDDHSGGVGHTHADHSVHEGDAAGYTHIGLHHVPLLSVLRYLRIFVYFSLGFGPVGLMAEASGWGLLGSLMWSVPAGIVAALLGLAFFKFQQRDVDSSIQIEDLFLGSARVIIPISRGNMGKVRVHIGQSVAERYALAEDTQDSFPVDAQVQIVRVTDDCVYVRRMDKKLQSDNF